MTKKVVRIVVENPKAFEVEDFLNAYAHENGVDLILVDPETKLRIFGERLNLAIIGLTTQKPRPHRQFGLLQSVETEPSDESDTTTVYDIEALLALQVETKSLPVPLEGETWAIKVKDYEKLEKFGSTAKALAEHFQVNIFMTADEEKDPDPDHQQPRTGLDGAVFCPLTPRLKK